MCGCAYVRMCARAHARGIVCVCVRARVCVYVCMYVCVCVRASRVCARARTELTFAERMAALKQQAVTPAVAIRRRCRLLLLLLGY